jgi:winged helix DNA-binding protein
MQSQEFAVAQWSIAQRTRGVTRAALDRAFAEGVILRTHLLRPTWHFVRPADIRWMMELTAPRVRAFCAYYDRKVELDDAVFRKSHALMRKALARGEHLTRKELAAVLQKGGIVAAGQRLGHLMMRAELDLVVCSGAMSGKQHTYALVEERAPRAKSLPREEALAELTRRYFGGHGPATLKDYMWWSSLTSADCKRGIEANARELEHDVVDGRAYWFATPLPKPRIASPAVHLLQGYDEYVIAYTESKRALSVAGSSGVPRGQTQFIHAIVAGGQVVGHWRRALGDAATIEARLSRPLSAGEERGLRAEVARYGRFIETKAGLRSQS